MTAFADVAQPLDFDGGIIHARDAGQSRFV